MAISRILPPPINVDANDWTFKKWFQDIYSYNSGGVLVPNAGISSNPNIFGGTRNVVINGDFQIWQRGITFSSSGGSTDYTADRWAISRAAGTQKVSRQLSSLPGFQFCARVERLSTDTLTTNLFFVQSIETLNSVPLAGQQVTLGFWARAGVGFSATTGTPFQVTITTGTGTDEGPFAAFTGGLNPLIYKPTLTTSWKFYKATATLNANTNELKVFFVWGPPTAAGANNYVEITGVQLEIGSTATAFDYKRFSEQLVNCQRYYQKSFPYATVPATGTGNSGALIYSVMRAGANAVAISDNFSTLMRNTASFINYFNPAAANAKWRNATLGADSGLAATQLNTSRFISIQNPQVVADSLGNLILVHWTFDAELY